MEIGFGEPFALAGLRIPGLRIQNPACVRKSFPDYFATLFRLLKR